jgi:hypothetical protein
MIGEALGQVAVVVTRYQTCFTLIQQINVMDLCDVRLMEYFRGLKAFLNASNTSGLRCSWVIICRLAQNLDVCILDKMTCSGSFTVVVNCVTN